MLRHHKRCGLEEFETVSRRHSCEQCVIHKTKCDLLRPECSRCKARSRQCTYVEAGSRKARPVGQSLPIPSTAEYSELDLFLMSLTPELSDGSPRAHNSVSGGTQASTGSSPERSYANDSVSFYESDQLESKSVELPLVSSAQMLHPLQKMNGRRQEQRAIDWRLYEVDKRPPNPETVLSPYRLNSTISILKTYPAMMARQEQLPPFIHRSQVRGGNTPVPLSNCFALTRLWHEKLVSDQNVIVDSIWKEMQRLLSEVCLVFGTLFKLVFGLIIRM
jgi:hypothetical protein